MYGDQILQNLNKFGTNNHFRADHHWKVCNRSSRQYHILCSKIFLLNADDWVHLLGHILHIILNHFQSNISMFFFADLIYVLLIAAVIIVRVIYFWTDQKFQTPFSLHHHRDTSGEIAESRLAERLSLYDDAIAACVKCLPSEKSLLKDNSVLWLCQLYKSRIQLELECGRWYDILDYFLFFRYINPRTTKMVIWPHGPQYSFVIFSVRLGSYFMCQFKSNFMCLFLTNQPICGNIPLPMGVDVSMYITVYSFYFIYGVYGVYNGCKLHNIMMLGMLVQLPFCLQKKSLGVKFLVGVLQTI